MYTNDFYPTSDIFDAIDQQTQIPEYYFFENYLPEKIRNIQELEEAAGSDGYSFQFVTDIHWPGNSQKAGLLTSYVAKRTNAQQLVVGGDMITAGDMREMMTDMRAAAYSFTSRLGEENVKFVFGNHEFNAMGNNCEQPVKITRNQVWTAVFAKNTGVFRWTGGFDYYFDAPGARLRFVITDTGETGIATAETCSWLRQKALDVSENWAVILIGHALIKGTYHNPELKQPELAAICDEYNARRNPETFSSLNGEVILLLTGHLHWDDNTTTPGGIPIVLTDTDCYTQNLNDRPRRYAMRNTKGEQVLDTIVVNRRERTLSFVRIGDGEDRTFSY